MDLARRKIRYYCFRKQNELAGGIESGAPEEIIKYFESDKFFDFLGGWANFAKTWDINGDRKKKRTFNSLEEIEILPLEKSLWQEWDEHCAKVVKDLPEISKAEKKDRDQKLPKKKNLSRTVEAVLKKS